MNLSFEILLVASLVLVFNILDSVTTALCFKQYPDKELKAESNPFMRKLMLKNGLLAEVVKQGTILVVLAFLLLLNDIFVIRVLAIAFALVVLSNSCIFLARVIKKREVSTPYRLLQKALHIADEHFDKYAHKVILVAFLCISIGGSALF